MHRILVVDDNSVFRATVIGLLQAEPGILVLGDASTGVEAVELARRLHPDIILMDVSMPRMNGIEATRRIKARMPEARVIGLSSYAETEIAERMREAGAEALVVKGASRFFPELLRMICEEQAPAGP
jgi:DNA-binding NarL/FixJ family response regulator